MGDYVVSRTDHVQWSTSKMHTCAFEVVCVVNKEEQLYVDRNDYNCMS